MDKVLRQIENIISEKIKEYLPKVGVKDLEEDGAIYYMNGQNGTAWDYYVNGHLSNFMVFYNDQNNLGIVKFSLYQDGKFKLYLYNEKGKKLLKEIDGKLDVSKEDLFMFATLLKVQMDDKGNFDANIDKIDANKKPLEKELQDFKNMKNDFKSVKLRSELMSKMALVSRKILDEDYKVGYMYREEPLNVDDSGWQFMVGNEAEDYVNNSKNFVLLSLDKIYSLDSDIWNYIDSPIGSAFIRISSNAFEKDHHDKAIFIEKR